MLESVKRFKQLYDLEGARYTVCEGKLFRLYQTMVRPLGPVKFDYSLALDDAYRVMKELGGVLIRCPGGWCEKNPQEWYAVICDEFRGMEGLKAKNRSEINRGLKNCRVEMVDAEFVSKYGYSVYVKAFRRYRGAADTSIWTGDRFRERLLKTKDFGDIVQYWGAFYNRRLIAFSINNVYDRIEAAYTVVKLDPEFLKLYPMYALIYAMNKHYLGERGFEYVNDGWRSILHETEVQKFLIDKFGFRKGYAKLTILYRPIVWLCMQLSYPFKTLLGRADRRLKALYTLEEIRRAGLAAGECDSPGVHKAASILGMGGHGRPDAGVNES